VGPSIGSFIVNRHRLPILKNTIVTNHSFQQSYSCTHGFPTKPLIWKSQVAFFVEKGFPVIAPDFWVSVEVPNRWIQARI
jgi:hypothetical protein